MIGLQRGFARAADERLAHVNLLASGVMSLLRTTVDGLDVEPAPPPLLRAAIQQVGEAIGALAEDVEARARHSRVVDRLDHRRLRR